MGPRDRAPAPWGRAEPLGSPAPWLTKTRAGAAESPVVFIFPRNLHGEAYFYLLGFTFSIQTASKRNAHHYCLWDTDMRAKSLGNAEKYRGTFPPAASLTQRQGHVGEDRLRRRMSDRISGGVWGRLSIFPAAGEFGKMKWEGTRLPAWYGRICRQLSAAQPLPLHRAGVNASRRDLHAQSAFTEGKKGFSPSFDHELMYAAGIFAQRVATCA